MRKSTSTDNLSSEAYNKRKGGSKENENRKKQREIINLAALLEVEKYMVFFFLPCTLENTAIGQVSAAVLSWAEFLFCCFFNYEFVWKLIP